MITARQLYKIAKFLNKALQVFKKTIITVFWLWVVFTILTMLADDPVPQDIVNKYWIFYNPLCQTIAFLILLSLMLARFRYKYLVVTGKIKEETTE